jgi:hypothetical protein
MTLPEDEEHPGVIKVKAMWDRGEFEKIDKMVKLWTALENIGALGDVLRRFIIWSGVIAMGYFAFSGWLSEWIRSIR